MEGTSDKFAEFWHSHCMRFIEEYPPTNAYPPPCKNPYFPWTMTERKIYRTREDWVKTKSLVFNDQNVIPEWFSSPSTPTDKSPARRGFVMWDRCILTPRYSDSIVSVGQAGGKYVNTDWVGILGCLNDVTTTKRPSGEFVFDVMNMPHAWDIIETAHILTHKIQDVGYYSETSSTLAAFVLKLCLALKYNLVVDMDPNRSKEDSLDSLDILGCRIHMSQRLRNPTMDIVCSGAKTLVADKDNLVISGSVQYEPQPNPNNVVAGKWMEVNRWSCLPTVVCFAGWQTSDFISHSQLVRFKTKKNIYWEVPVQAQEPPSMFYGLIPKSEPDNIRYFHLEDYWKSGKYKADRGIYPCLPCRSCMKVNQKIEGCPQRPAGEPGNTGEWLKYSEGMNAIFQTCQKAALYQEGRKIGHTKAKKRFKSAQLNYSELKKLNDKLLKLENKAAKKRAEGYISESRKLRAQAEEIKNKIAEMEGSTCVNTA